MSVDEVFEKFCQTKVLTPEEQDVLFEAGLLEHSPFTFHGRTLTIEARERFAKRRAEILAAETST